MEYATPAYYRTVDPVENLVVRISIRKSHEAGGATLVGASIVPAGAPTHTHAHAHTHTHTQSMLQHTGAGLPTAFDEDKVEHVVEFAWQQKVFGPRELLKYAGALKDTQVSGRGKGEFFTPLERQYMCVLQERMEAGEAIFGAVSSIMLFTYTDRDAYVPPGEVSRAMLQPRGGGTAAPGGGTGQFTGGGGGAAGMAGAAGTAGTRPGFGDAAPGAASPASALTHAVINPLADPTSVVAHAYKENPYKDMYVMAAVGIAKEEYRAARQDTRMYEVPILHIRAHASAAETTLIELRPGFAEPLPIDTGVLRAAAAGGLTANTVLGPGAYGGDLKVRLLRLPTYSPPPPGATAAAYSATLPSAVIQAPGTPAPPPVPGSTPGGLASTVAGFGLASATPSAGGAAAPVLTSASAASLGSALALGGPGAPTIAAIVEVHSFTTRDGARYEYVVTNPDEDAVTALMAAQASGAPVPLSGTTALASTMHAALLSDVAAAAAPDSEALVSAAATGDALAALLAAERRAVEAAAHRVGSDFFSALPSGMHEQSFRVSCYLELVAAVDFVDEALAGRGVYIAYELVLPTGSGWRLLDPAESGTSNEYAHSQHSRGGRRTTRRTSQGEAAALPAHTRDLDDDGTDDDAEASSLRQRTRASHSPSAGAARSHHPHSASLRSGVQGFTQVARFRAQQWHFASQPSAADVGAGTTESSYRSSIFGTSTTKWAAQSVDGIIPSGGTLTHRRSKYTSNCGTSSLLTTQFVDGIIPSQAYKGLSGCDWAQPPDAGIVRVTEDCTSRKEVAHLCFPLELHLLCNMHKCSAPAGPAPPQIYFTVYSRDSWDRHRVCGYGVYDLPVQPGHHEANVHTWMPRMPISHEQESFFVGGGTRLVDPTHAGTPADFWAARAIRSEDDSSVAEAVRRASLSRFGMETVTAGSIAVRCSTLQVKYKPHAPPRVAEAIAQARLQSVGDIIAHAKALKQTRPALATLVMQSKRRHAADGEGKASSPVAVAEETAVRVI